MQSLIAPVQKKEFWLKAEPNWPVLASEFPDDYEFNAYARIYCDLETKSTFAVTVGDSLDTFFGDSLIRTTPSNLSSWCGYEWQENGDCYELEYGPDASCEWWSIDDVLFGAFHFGYLGTVNSDTHCVASIEEIVEYFGTAHYVTNKVNCAKAIAYWWHELTPAEEVKYGLTQAELNDEIEEALALFDRL